jgi:hypothetical protein
MRDSLIELLCSAPLGSRTFEQQYYKNTITKIADYLLERGVIHIPCKVGDVVYQTDGVNIYESEVCEISLSKRSVIYYTENAVAFDETALGKSIFLTKEEAERRLTK